MSKTGGGPGSNQYGLKGVGKPSGVGDDKANPESSVDLGVEREWDLHHVQYGETPIDEVAREFLTERYRDIVTKDELNRAESLNIDRADFWLDSRPFTEPANLLNQSALRDLHRRMFGAVWSWAGKFRVRDTNIGVEPHLIVERFEVLLGDIKSQIDHDVHPRVEIGVRFHHEILLIHCFPNGNGRHARLAANELARLLGLGSDVYSWGRRSGEDPEPQRRRYLDALKSADETDDYGALTNIALS